MKKSTKLITGLLSVTILGAAVSAPVLAKELEGPGETMVHTVRSAVKWGAILGTLTTKNSDGTWTVTTKVGKSITVSISDSTKLLRRFGAKSSVDEMQMGDKLSIRGTWANTEKTSLTATWIRDESIQKRNASFTGTVTSTSDTSFVLQPVRRKPQTVTVSSETKLTDRRGGSINESDVQTGNKVIVSGVWDSTNSTLTEVSRVRDLSLPLKK